MIEIQNIRKSFGDKVVLDGVNLSIEKGGIFGLIGVSGAGKSTLLRCINRLETFEEGAVTVGGVDVGSLRKHELRDFRREIGMVFQQFSLLERKSVFENVQFPLKCKGVGQRQSKARVLELLDLVGLAEKRDALPRELSGGQKQRVAIARALIGNPNLLLSDEATSALDPNITGTILQLLRRINRELGITVIVVTHETSVMKEVCGSMGLLSAGRLEAVGTVDRFFLEEPSLLREFMTGASGHTTRRPGSKIVRIILRDSDPESILARLAISSNVEFRIIDGNIDRYQSRIAGALNIEIPGDALPVISENLDNLGAEWKVV